MNQNPCPAETGKSDENEAEKPLKEEAEKKTVKKRICLELFEENQESDPEEDGIFKPAKNRHFHSGADR